MRLKRGLERESCDFCHRRKVKCDRPSRAKQGLDVCSQCAIRGQQCQLDDSNDVRLQRRRRRQQCASGGDITGTSSGEGLGTPTGLANTTWNTPDTSASSFAPAAHVNPLLPENDVFSQMGADDMFTNESFGLSLESIMFLDQVFMGGDGGQTDWTGPIPVVANQQPTASTATVEDSEGMSQTRQRQHINTLPDATLDQSCWPDSSAESPTFITALYTYFSHAAAHLPIVLEDAFWQDYHAGRSSHALVYAVACRGMPFTTAADKWTLQQRLARKFRDAFLDARSSASDDGAVRLDDLEALALMANVEYDDADSPGTGPRSNLGGLYLKHESLVLMTLQSRAHGHGANETDLSSPMLARAEERRMLLYWHVYGLDSFRCVDRKEASLIPSSDTSGSSSSGNDGPAQHEAHDYIDAILGLSTIARRIAHTLCTAAAKRRGVDPGDVHDLYKRLYHWRDKSCPRHLRRRPGEGGGLEGSADAEESGGDGTRKKHLQLHRAVLWALEMNCFLQIEACVCEFGVCQDDNDKRLEAETAALRVEYESVQVLTSCQWTKQLGAPPAGRDEYEHSLADLSPVLRNILAGMCFWTCRRGVELCRRGVPSLLQVRRGGGGAAAATAAAGVSVDDNNKKRHVETYLETSGWFREAVATARSHKETGQMLEGLDRQREMLIAELGGI